MAKGHRKEINNKGTAGGDKRRKQKEKKRAEKERIEKLLAGTGRTGPAKVVIKEEIKRPPPPKLPPGVKNASIGGKGCPRRKYRSIGNFTTFDEVAVENKLIKWRPMHVQNDVLNVVAVMGDGGQLIWEKPDWIRFLKKYNCFIVLGCQPDLLEPPESIPGAPDQPPDVTGNQPKPTINRELEGKKGKKEKQLKRYLEQALNMQRLEPISVVVFELPDQLWTVMNPEFYAIGIDSYAFFGDMKFSQKQVDQPDETPDNSKTQSNNQKSWDEEQAELLAKIQAEQSQPGQPDQEQVVEEEIGMPMGYGDKPSFHPVQTTMSNESNEVQTVMRETNCTSQEAEDALLKSGGDIVNAILDLSF